MTAREINPFRYSGPLEPEDMIDRDAETDDLLALTDGGHSFRLVGPRRYGKTTLLRRVLAAAEREEMATVLVDLQDVLSLSEIVVRIERAYKALRGPVRRRVDDLLRAWDIGVSLGGAGFTATLTRNPNVPADAVLLRILELPEALFERHGTASLIVFDEFQDVLAVPGADGKIRSVIQHQGRAATYAFAGSAPGMMDQLFNDPKRPLLEQAVPQALAPLARGDVARYIEERFAMTQRDPGAALDPLLDFTRGHPQRSMMLAHYLWHETGHAGRADETTWRAVIDRVTEETGPVMYGYWRALALNERRVTRALATASSSLYGDEAEAVFGLNPNSVRRALEGLRAKADVITVDGQPTLTDPVFERWLATRGPLPGESEDGAED